MNRIASSSAWLGVAWIAVGVASVTLVASTREWEVYNNTGDPEGGSGLFFDGAQAFMWTWLVAVPISYGTWRWADSTLSKVLGFVVAALVTTVSCWLSAISVYGIS